MRFQLILTAKDPEAICPKIVSIFKASTWAEAGAWADQFLKNFRSAHEYESTVTYAPREDRAEGQSNG